MDLSGSGTSTARSTTSSEIRLCVGEEGMVEVEMESPKAAIGEATRVDPGSIDDSPERHSQQTVTPLIIHFYPSN